MVIDSPVTVSRVIELPFSMSTMRLRPDMSFPCPSHALKARERLKEMLKLSGCRCQLWRAMLRLNELLVLERLDATSRPSGHGGENSFFD